MTVSKRKHGKAVKRKPVAKKVAPVENNVAINTDSSVPKAVEVPITNKREERFSRKRRGKVGGMKNKLTYNGKKNPEYEYRFVNDDEDSQRVQALWNNDWDFVHDANAEVGDPTSFKEAQMGDTISRHVGTGMKAYLMRKPKEWYNEDQKAKQDEITRQEKGMAKQVTSPKSISSDEQYGKVEISK